MEITRTSLRVAAAVVAALLMTVVAGRAAAAAPSDTEAIHESQPEVRTASPPATPGKQVAPAANAGGQARTGTRTMSPAAAALIDQALSDPAELERLADVAAEIEELLASYADVLGTLAGHDVGGMLGDEYAGVLNTLATLGDHGFDPADLDFGPNAGLGEDLLGALEGLLPSKGSTGHPAEGLAAGWFVAAAVVVLVAGGAYIISDGISRIGSGDSGSGAGAGSGAPATSPADDPAAPEGEGGDGEKSADDWDEEADGWAETAEQSERQAEDESLSDEEREQAQKDAEYARQREKEAREKAEEARKKKQDEEMPGPDGTGGNPFAFDAWLLATHPWLEGTQIDRLGQFVDMVDAKNRGEDPRTVNPSPIDDGSPAPAPRTGEEPEEIDVKDPGIVDPTEDTRNVKPSKSQVERLHTARPGPGGDIRVIYPSPEDAGEPEPDAGPGAMPGGGNGCEAC